MKTYILVFSVAAALCSCGKKERIHFQLKIDSLTNALNESKKTEVAMSEVGVMLDSIDASRHALHTKIVEGISYADYISRLKDINTNIKNSQIKLAALEHSLKNSKNVSTAAIHRLKEDLDLRSKEIIALQLDVARVKKKAFASEFGQLDVGLGICGLRSSSVRWRSLRFPHVGPYPHPNTCPSTCPRRPTAAGSNRWALSRRWCNRFSGRYASATGASQNSRFNWKH